MSVHLSRAAASSKTGYTLTLCLTGVCVNTTLVPVFEPEVCFSQDFLGQTFQGRLRLGHLTVLGVPSPSLFKELLLTLSLCSSLWLQKAKLERNTGKQHWRLTC